MNSCDASTPGLISRTAYLVFVPEAEALVCKKVFGPVQEAYEFAFSVGGFVVRASKISQISSSSSLEEVTVHELRLEE